MYSLTEETALDNRAIGAANGPAIDANDDPMLRYCLRLEERIVWQTREIESLRQMLNSEHSRHEGADPPRLSLLQRLRRIV